MLKRNIFTMAAALLSLTAAIAQNKDVRQQVGANLELARGHYYINPNEAGPQTKAPKGYKAFYISHVARHGARYCWEDIYTRMDTLLQKAHDTGHLTPKGEALYSSLHNQMPVISWHMGELTPKGWEQHRQSAKNISRLFPEVFRKGASISATSSTEDRCEMSMASYCLELTRNYPDLQLYQYVSSTDFDAVLPTSSRNPLRISSPPTELPFPKTPDMKVDLDEVLGQYFTDVQYADSQLMRKGRLVGDLYTLWCCFECSEEDLDMEDPFSPEQELKYWEQSNLGSFNYYYSLRYQSWSILGDIVEKAERRIRTDSSGMDLRFTHDSHFGPLICLIDVGMNGTIAPTPQEQCEYFQDFNICMASNLHFVFYRSARNPEILFKVLLNGKETTMPLTPVEGPYYRWSDLKTLSAQLKPKTHDSL